MDQRPPFPWPSVVLAITGCAILLFDGASPLRVSAVALLWIGSLLLVQSRAPGITPRVQRGGLTPETMATLFELSGTAVIVTDRDRVFSANSEAKRTLGSHVIGQDVRVALRHPQAISLLARPDGGTATIRGLAQRRDIWRIGRKVLDERLAVIELLDKTSETDISRAHTDFVANASHELRTPLAAVSGYLETLRDDWGELDPNTAARFLDTALREAHRMQALVADLLSLSRIEAEKHDRPETPVMLGPVVRRAARDAAGDAQAERLRLNVDDAEVLGDEPQLEQMVRNLVGNALTYSPESSTVTVTLEQATPERAVLTVADTGPGIAREHLPHLTRRFYRVDAGRSRASGGTGLGLAIVKHIVERHGGTLDIESELGVGTKALVRLPLRRREEAGNGASSHCQKTVTNGV